MSPAHYLLLANLTLALHLCVVAFIVFMVPLAWAGRWRRWRWVGNRWLRAAHLLFIAFVAVQSWLGLVCPLTVLEMWLRHRAGDTTYDVPFVQHWLERVLYHRWPLWAFVAGYSGFFALVVATLWIVPVRWRNAPFCAHEP